KTARSIPSEGGADELGEQLILYAQGCQPIAKQLGARITLRYVFISKIKEPRVEALSVKLDEARVKRSCAIIRQVCRAMHAGIVFSGSSDLAHHATVSKLQLGDVIFHYATKSIRAISRVTSGPQEGVTRPYASNPDSGRQAKVAYAELKELISLTDLPKRWRK